MICSKCGRRTYKDEKYCPKCGAPMPERQRVVLPSFSVQSRRDEDHEAPETSYREPVYPEPQEVFLPEPEEEPVYEAEPIFEQEPEGYYEPYQEPYQEPEVGPEPEYSPPVAEQSLPEEEQHSRTQAPDYERTLTFKEARTAPKTSSAAAMHYSALRQGIHSAADEDDGTKIKLDRLPEGYVYVKMSVEDASRMSHRFVPVKVVLAAIALVVVGVVLIVLLSTRQSPIIGEWSGVIDATTFKIEGVNVKLLDTTWEFEAGGKLNVMAKVGVSPYNMRGTYSLSQEGEQECIDISLTSPFDGETQKIDAYYTITDRDGQKQLKLISKYNEAIVYTLDRVS